MKRILVAGGGLIGRRHCAAVAAHTRCVLAGLVDPDPSVEAEAPRYAGLAQAPDDFDRVIIAAPTALHADLGREAAARGWHMPINEPVTATLEEARMLQNAQPPLEAQLDHFLGVMDGQPPLCSIADATRTLRVTLEVERQLSSQTIDGAHPEFV